VLRCALFPWKWRICIVLCMLPRGCACSRRCCANLEVWQFFWNDCLVCCNVAGSFVRSDPHTLSCILGMWACRLRTVRIYLSRGVFGLGVCRWCCWCGTRSLCLCFWICLWCMCFPYQCRWMWSIFVFVFVCFAVLV
jgi:hypothetical protein